MLTTIGCGDSLVDAKYNCFFYLSVIVEDDVVVAPENFVIPAKVKDSNIPRANLTVSLV